MENNQQIKFLTPAGIVSGILKEMPVMTNLAYIKFTVSISPEDWLKIDMLHTSASGVMINNAFPEWALVTSYDAQFIGAYYKIIEE